MKIISADERLAEKSGAKILIIGPSGIGKTSLLRTMSAEMLASTLFVDIEAGHIAVADLPVASVRPQRWEECRDLACALGGFNPALRDHFEPPNLFALIGKLTGPGQRKPFTIVSIGQEAQAKENGHGAV